MTKRQSLDQHSYTEPVLSSIIYDSNKTYTYNYKSLISTNLKHISNVEKIALNAISSNLTAGVPKSNLKLRAVTIDEVLERFKSKTSDSCLNSCEVNQKSGASYNAEKSDNYQNAKIAKNVIPGCDIRTREGWREELRKGHILGVPLYDADEFMFPFEHDLFSRPRLTHLKGLPDLKTSTIYHLTYSRSNSNSRNGTGIDINLGNGLKKGNGLLGLILFRYA